MNRLDTANATATSGAKVPNGRSFITLLAAFRATGGTAPGEVMARLLAERRGGRAGDFAALIDTGQAFGFEWRSSLWVPMFQFDGDDLSLKAGAQEVRAALPLAYSGWSVAAWFAEPIVRLDDCSPADRLDADLGAVLRAARSQSLLDRYAPSRLRSTDRSTDEPYDDDTPWLQRGLPIAPRAPRLERSRFHDLPR